MGSGEIRSGKAYKLSYDRDLRRPRLFQADKGKVSIIGLGGKLGLAHGWPDAITDYKHDGKRRIARKDDVIWLLKCSPHCWRLYFYVQIEEKRIIYVHAICKKKDDEDDQGFIKARRIADRVKGGKQNTVREFKFPS